MEMLKKNPVNMNFIEEEIIIKVKFEDVNIRTRMIIDRGAPLSTVSSNWLKRYVEENKVDDN